MKKIILDNAEVAHKGDHFVMLFRRCDGEKAKMAGL